MLYWSDEFRIYSHDRTEKYELSSQGLKTSSKSYGLQNKELKICAALNLNNCFMMLSYMQMIKIET